MTAIYLAARYGRRDELMGYAADLHERDHIVTARWIDGRHETPPAGIAVDSVEHLAWAAAEDLADIQDADVLIAVTEPEGVVNGRGRGGRHVELGYAMALGKRIIVVGHRENIFCCLPGVAFAANWATAMAMLAHWHRR